jgi:phospholipid/cholesterol/gamma-HCH transport system permease protein
LGKNPGICLSSAVTDMFRELGQMLVLLGATLKASPQILRRRRAVGEQIFEIGNASLLMACMLSFFIGGVLVLQAGSVLVERGLGSQLGGLVGISLCKELAPVMMAILIAGRIGSAMAAELGSMQVYQEVDALRTLNIPPISYLVLPRIVAITVALPALVVFSNLVGWLGGAVVASFNSDIGVPTATFFANLREVVETWDIVHGLIKATVFAVAVGIVCCHQGLQTRGGPRGVGRSVTKAVTNSIVLVLLLDYALTRLLQPFDS